MATPPTVIRTGDPIDLILEDISASLVDLPSILEDQERGELSEHERDVLSMEWIREVHHLRRILDPAYRSGRMTPAQQERYRALLARLKDAMPIIERLGFASPQVPLEP